MEGTALGHDAPSAGKEHDLHWEWQRIEIHIRP